MTLSFKDSRIIVALKPQEARSRHNVPSRAKGTRQTCGNTATFANLRSREERWQIQDTLFANNIRQSDLGKE